MPISEGLIKSFKCIIPPLTHELHKGSMGRVGVLGGSAEFTGAPYFSATAALRAGADLAYVFSEAAAAPVVKTYSPELMVMPYLDSDHIMGKISPWLGRLHSVVIGPGLGRGSKSLSNVSSVIKALRTTRIEQTNFQSLVFDADGLYFASRNVDLLRDYPGHLYLTPNKVELTNFVNALVGHECREGLDYKLALIERELGKGVTIIVKGAKDTVYCDGKMVEVDVEGSARRCGGQGDMLSGFVGTFSTWVADRSRAGLPNAIETIPDRGLAGVAACALTRVCSRLAFAEKGRSTLTTDMLTKIHEAYSELFGS